METTIYMSIKKGGCMCKHDHKINLACVI